MKNRPWILVVAIILGLLLFFGNRWYRSDEVQSQIRNSVEIAVAEMIGGDVSIQEMKIGLLSVKVSGLALSIPLNSITIEIDQLHIGFSLSALLRKKWEPQELIDRITIVDPHITLIAGSTPPKDDTPDESPSIEEMIPFRKAIMKGCIVTIEHPRRGEILTIRNLDGEIIRDGSIAEVKLNGAVGSLVNNVSLSATLSDNIDEQHLSLRLRSLDLQDVVPENDIAIHGMVNASIESEFSEGHFPSNIIPNGWLKIERFALSDTSGEFVNSGEVDIVLEEGVLNSQLLQANIPGGTVTGNLNFKFEESLSGVISLIGNLSSEDAEIGLIENLTGTVDLEIEVPSVFAEELPLRGSADLLYSDQQLDFTVSGNTIVGGVVLDTVQLDSDFGTVSSQLSFVDNFLDYQGKASLNSRLTEDYLLRGAVPFTVLYDFNTELPEIQIDSRNLRIVGNGKTFQFPPMQLQTIRESVLLQGSDDRMSIVAHVANLLEPLAQYHVEVQVSQQGVESLLDFADQAELVDQGNITFEVDGIDGVSSIRAGVSAKSFWGDLSLLGQGEWGGERNRFHIDNGSYQWEDGLDYNFAANIQELDNGDWGVSLIGRDLKLDAEGEFSEDFSTIRNLNAEISLFPLPWLNKLIPSEDIIIRAGELSGEVTLQGSVDSLQAVGELNLSTMTIGSLDSMNTQININWDGSRGIVAPFTLNRQRHIVIESDSVVFGDSLALGLEITRLDIGRALSFLPGDPISGTVSGFLSQQDSVLHMFATMPAFTQGELELDSIRFQAQFKDDTLTVDSAYFVHDAVRVQGSGVYPIAGGVTDTLQFEVEAEGDLISSVGKFSASPVGGTGNGSVLLKGSVANGEWIFTDARILIPHGEMTVPPYVHGAIENLYADLQLYDNDSVALSIRGSVEGQQIVVKNDYDYASEFDPMLLGSVDLGVIRIFTEQGGVPLYVPGFIENRPGNVGFVEAAGKDSIPAFTLSGMMPDNFLVTGTLLLRKVEITFPLLDDYDWGDGGGEDPFPMIGFDLDVRAADRSVTYFYQVGDPNRRRSIRMVECNFDPSGTIGVRGRDQEGTFRVTGEVRSYTGFLFYGRMFDQNFEMGLDFSSGAVEGEKHDNLPIIWGSAEAYADTNRLERTEVILMTRADDGSLVRRGRFTEELVVMPATGDTENGNIDEQSADFYRNTGQNLLGLEGAGTTISGIGDRYMNSFFFNYWGRQAARHIGLDMIRLETSVMSNTFSYLYENQLDSSFGQNLGHLALENTGITFGKYIANDQLLLKMRTQFSTLDTLLIPEYKVGVEYQPLRYLWMDVNYGIKQDYTTGEMYTNPEVRVQFRMPFSKFESVFNGD